MKLYRQEKHPLKRKITVSQAGVLLKAEEEKKDLLRSKLVFAEAFCGDADLKPGEKYLDLLNDLQICSKNGLFLVARVLKCCKYFEKEKIRYGKGADS